MSERGNARIFARSDRRRNAAPGAISIEAGNIMSRVLAALSTAAILAFAAAPASAGCVNCYAPPPCVTCYQQQVIPPQYRTVNETVMVSPGRRVAHRTPARYETVMVPKTVMVEPEGVQYEEIPAAIHDRAAHRDGRAGAHRRGPGAPALQQLRLVAQLFH